MILTGFSDIEAIIQAINDGHVYAYITKPWEPEQLKQLMKQAVDHHKLTVRTSACSRICARPTSSSRP